MNKDEACSSRRMKRHHIMMAQQKKIESSMTFYGNVKVMMEAQSNDL
jgi:hypothetical protein